jgi:hypothetical protein
MVKKTSIKSFSLFFLLSLQPYFEVTRFFILMKKYKLVDTILGWIVFVVAAFTYCSTIEPTASFWDCPEFIATAFKQEIGHPPGAPFFGLVANLFSQFASDPSHVAKMVNTMSALLSATCILFLFWTITHLVRKLILKNWDELTPAKVIAIEASGVVGALIYTWSDTFWFSAVEGEVYAFSSAFTAIVFWLILKWEDHADEPHSDRWLVLITLYDRALHRRASVEPVVSACNRAGILLPEIQTYRPERITHRTAGRICPDRSRYCMGSSPESSP